jgi:hypothetical protein
MLTDAPAFDVRSLDRAGLVTSRGQLNARFNEGRELAVGLDSRSSLHVRPSTATEAAGLHPVCGDASRSRDERNLSNITLHLTNEQLAHGEE